MKRTFVAVKIHPGDKMRDAVMEFREALISDKIKWIDLINLHITLSFLGDTSDDMVEIVSEKVENIARMSEPFELNFTGMGIFRNLRNPKVLWIGIEHNPVIGTIKKTLDQELKILGFGQEDREYRPHLTVGRIKWIRDKGMLQDLLEKHKDIHFQISRIDHLIYYESILRPEGPEYVELNRVRLG